MASQVFRFVALGALVVGGVAGVVACSDSSPQAEPVAAAITNGLAPSSGHSHKVGQFIAHVDHAKGQFVIEPLGAPIVLGDNLEPTTAATLTQNQYVLPDGGGKPTANTVDLVTTSYLDSYPSANTFTATVELRSFYTRALANVFVDITSVTLDGGPITGYDSTNNSTGNPLGLPTTHGLWSYSTSAATDGGFLTANSDGGQTSAGTWTATQTWDFANANDENIVYTIAVYASTTFASYTQGFGTASYIDVCGTSGAGSTTGNKKNNIALPFDFTIYSTNTSTVSMGNDGILAFGMDVTNTNGNVQLPDASVPGPAFFPFWDNLVNAPDGGVLCWAQTGTQPNLVEALEWKNMQIGGGTGAGSTLDFEVLLHEGTGVIDTVYNSMVAVDGGAGRAAGNKATVGILNEDGTVTTSEFNKADFGTGKAYTYLPAP